MDYQKLKDEIKEIAEISELAPEPLRAKCFEMLLAHLLGEAPSGTHGGKGGKKPAASGDEKESKLPETPPAGGQLPMPAAIKAFLRRTNLTAEELESVVMMVDEEFHFIKEPSHQKVAQGQNEWALLLALKNGITENSMTADPEAIRSIVQDKGFYDQANFSKNFKSQKYAGWYKGAMESQGEARALTQDGERELAALIKRLIAEAK